MLQLNFLADTLSNLHYEKNAKQGSEMRRIQGKCCFEGMVLTKIIENIDKKRDAEEKRMLFPKKQKTDYPPMHLSQFRNF